VSAHADVCLRREKRQRSRRPARPKAAHNNAPVLTRVLVMALGVVGLLGAQGVRSPESVVAERVGTLTRESSWRLVRTVPIRFRTFHPQGMVKIGTTWFISSVEVHDRAAGRGIGHLFKVDSAGNLRTDLALGEGAMYHPSGIDFDGASIWIALAEYRPNSRSIIYRVDPETMKATEMFRVADHIGAITHDTDDGLLHGVSWGSRSFYRWSTTGGGAKSTMNRSHYLDYQDCKYVGENRMLCSGVTEMRQTPGAPPFRLGGLEIVNLQDGRTLAQVPVLLWTSSGVAMTQNPVWLEPSAEGLRAYFLPEDDRSTIYVYEVGTP
jgi:hypothetical protein